MYCLAEHARPFAVNDTHRRQTGHEGSVKVMVKLGQGFVYSEPP
jgi:hypothetical protein